VIRESYIAHFKTQVIIGVQSRRMTFARHVMCLGKMRNTCGISLAEREWKRLLGYLGVYARIISK
jgi:hypothetical protein